MVVLAIAAIMVTVATPSFRGLLRGFRITSATNELFAAVNLTRAEAIARGSRVDLVPKGGDWTKGWVVFVDNNANQTVESSDQLILSHDPLPSGFVITTSFDPATPKFVAYNAAGHSRSNASSQATRAGNWLITLDGQSRKIVINFLGRARVCNPDTDSSC
jgi:type IV fimbrial biogenesis protein FimT